MDLSPYSRINPCGFKGLEVVSLEALGSPVSYETVADALVHQLAAQFGLHAVETVDRRAGQVDAAAA
jgi:lipoyl(octanoyl) transferase